MKIDEWGYAKINGVRVKAERYKRKIKQLERQDGRRGRRTGSRLIPSGQEVKIHSATKVLIPPTKRQAYPRFKWVIDCEFDGWDSFGVAPSCTVTCNNCLKSRRYKEAQATRKKASRYMTNSPFLIEKETLRKLFKGWGSANEQRQIEAIERGEG